MTDAIEQAADPARLLEARIVAVLKLGPARNMSLRCALGYRERYTRELYKALQSMRKRGAIEWVGGRWRLVCR